MGTIIIVKLVVFVAAAILGLIFEKYPNNQWYILVILGVVGTIFGNDCSEGLSINLFSILGIALVAILGLLAGVKFAK